MDFEEEKKKRAMRRAGSWNPRKGWSAAWRASWDDSEVTLHCTLVGPWGELS